MSYPFEKSIREDNRKTRRASNPLKDGDPTLAVLDVWHDAHPRRKDRAGRHRYVRLALGIIVCMLILFSTCLLLDMMNGASR